MDTTELALEFISNSRNFYNDSDIEDIDNKHTKIVAEAYRAIENGWAYDKINFRSWSGQSDIAVPAQYSSTSRAKYGYLGAALRLVYGYSFGWNENRNLLNGFKDDISIIKSIGGIDLLRDNPAHRSVGNLDAYFIEKTSVNLRWLRYIYFTRKILSKKLLPDDGVWVDVGSYYGGVQGILLKYRPNARYVLVDFHHQLCRSYIYLTKLFPKLKHIFPDDIYQKRDFRDLDAGTVMYVPIQDYSLIENNNDVDLATNFFSFGEMHRAIFEAYISSSLFSNAKRTYLINRWVSSPFFEKTYDADLTVEDYLRENRVTDYLDVFPMSHYLALKRELFGFTRYRNPGSSYFELLTSKRE